MSWICDSTELVSGAWLTSAYAGHGVLAEDIPSSGESGASVLYDQVSLPGDNGKEVRGLILTQPSGLSTWSHAEDGVVIATAPDGVYTYTMQVYVDGAALGSPVTITLTFGAATVTMAVTGGSGTLNAQAVVAAQALLSATGGSGTLLALAGAGASAALALTGGSGTLAAQATGYVPEGASWAGTGGSGALSAAARVSPLAVWAATGGSGALVAQAAGPLGFVQPAARNTLVEPPELRMLLERTERRTIAEPLETRTIDR